MDDNVAQLFQQKDELEQEIQELTAYLNAPGMPGLSGGLVDAEGFPLADVEKIIAVRQARHRLACKQQPSLTHLLSLCICPSGMPIKC